jgi:hypothetical protein
MRKVSTFITVATSDHTQNNTDEKKYDGWTVLLAYTLIHGVKQY